MFNVVLTILMLTDLVLSIFVFRKHDREIAAKNAEIAKLKEDNSKLNTLALIQADKIDIGRTK